MFALFLVLFTALSPALAFSGLHVTETSNETVMLFCEEQSGVIAPINQQSILDRLGESGKLVAMSEKAVKAMPPEEYAALREQLQAEYHGDDKGLRDAFAKQTRSGLFFGGWLETCVALRGYVIEVIKGEAASVERREKVYTELGFENPTNIHFRLQELVRQRVGDGVSSSKLDIHLAEVAYFGERYQEVMDAVYPVITVSGSAEDVTLGSVTIAVLRSRGAVKNALERRGQQDEFNDWSRPRLWGPVGISTVVFNAKENPLDYVTGK